MYCSECVDNDLRYWLTPKTDFEGSSPYNCLTRQYEEANYDWYLPKDKNYCMVQEFKWSASAVCEAILKPVLMREVNASV